VIADCSWESQVVCGFQSAIKKSSISNQQLLQAREEARDRRHGESSLPPAAST
jgi:hypothetical protein